MWSRGRSQGKLCRSSACAAILWLGIPSRAFAENAPRVDLSSNVRIGDSDTNTAVRQALQRAARRVNQPACQQVLSEFQDAAGSSMQAVLDQSGRGFADHLGTLLFYDGSKGNRCRSASVMAFTEVGSHVVLVCPSQFRSEERRRPSEMDVLIIHEALHTLGLGENPPTPREISVRVRARCVSGIRTAQR